MENELKSFCLRFSLSTDGAEKKHFKSADFGATELISIFKIFCPTFYIAHSRKKVVPAHEISREKNILTFLRPFFANLTHYSMQELNDFHILARIL